MASLLDKKVVNDDKKFLVGIIAVFIIVLWLFSPMGNRFAQISFWANNVSFFISKVTNIGSVPEYQHYRNNAVYLANVYPKRSKPAIDEINKAIEKAPDYLSDRELAKLYSDRAQIKLYYGDKKGALEDYLSAGSLSVNDDLKAAVLLTERGQYKMASDYCKDIIANNYQAFSGYACLAHVYESAGKTKSALSLYDLAIESKPNNARAYFERAQLKKRLNDDAGYKEDMNKAIQLSPNVQNEASLIDEAVNLKRLSLTII